MNNEEIKYQEKPPCPTCKDKYPNETISGDKIVWRCRFKCNTKWETPIKFEETIDDYSQIECPVCKEKFDIMDIDDQDEINCDDCGSLLMFSVEYSKSVTAHVLVPRKEV